MDLTAYFETKTLYSSSSRASGRGRIRPNLGLRSFTEQTILTALSETWKSWGKDSLKASERFDMVWFAIAPKQRNLESNIPQVMRFPAQKELGT
jgi:hypothetical protein